MRYSSLTLACAMLFGATQAYAEELSQEATEGYIKYRENVMESASGNMGAAAQIISGKVALPDRLAMHAQALQALMTDLPMLFPAGSDFGETDAKTSVWENADKFALAAETALGKAKAFNDAVAGGDAGAVAASFKELGGACKGCHKEFKAKH